MVVANLIGADPTALGDRALAEGNPHLILEGLLVAAFATGAQRGVPCRAARLGAAIERLRAAVAEAEAAHLAGYLMLGTDVSVQVALWEGSGALVAGEETALLAALSGDRGMPIIRPPYPSERGFMNAPTMVQNAETLAHAAWILAHSVQAFASLGSEQSKGTKLVSIFGRVAEAGLDRGAPRHLADGPADGGRRRIGSTKALFVGGSGGGAIDAASLDMAYDFEPLEAAGAVVGLGSVLVTDAGTCMVDTARFFLDHSAREACGKAVPCRIGTKRLVETLDRILAATPRPNDFELLRSLSRKMRDTALCHLGHEPPAQC